MPGVVHMRVAYGANGQLVCTGLLITSEDGQINTTALRDVPVSKMLAGLIERYGLDNEDVAWKAIDEVELPPVGPSGLGQMLIFEPTATVARNDEPPRRGGSAPSRERLARFARDYRFALNSPEWRHKPVAYAAEESGISLATAHRWRARCEEKGLLDRPAK